MKRMILRRRPLGYANVGHYYNTCICNKMPETKLMHNVQYKNLSYNTKFFFLAMTIKQCHNQKFHFFLGGKKAPGGTQIIL